MSVGYIMGLGGGGWLGRMVGREQGLCVSHLHLYPLSEYLHLSSPPTCHSLKTASAVYVEMEQPQYIAHTECSSNTTQKLRILS
jgi:hypothetical protein